MALDVLADERAGAISSPLQDLRRALESQFKRFGRAERLRLSPFSRKLSDARKWLDRAGSGVLMVSSQSRWMSLTSRRSGRCSRSSLCARRTAWWGGFRYATDSKQVGSMRLGFYDAEAKLDHVGFTSGVSDADRPSLTKKLEKLRGGTGFTGGAPGGPSRWSTERSAEWVSLKPKLVAEIAFDQVTGDRFRHGTRFVRWRPDKAPKQCTFDQMQREARPSD